MNKQTIKQYCTKHGLNHGHKYQSCTPTNSEQPWTDKIIDQAEALGYERGVRAAIEVLPENLRYNEDTVPKYLKPAEGENWEQPIRHEQGFNQAIDQTRTNLEQLLKG